MTAHDTGAKDRDSHFSPQVSERFPPLDAVCAQKGQSSAVFGFSLSQPKPRAATAHEHTKSSPSQPSGSGAHTSPRSLAEHSPTAQLCHKCSSREGPQTHLHVQGAVLDQAISSLHMYSLVTAAFDPILFVSR